MSSSLGIPIEIVNLVLGISTFLYSLYQARNGANTKSKKRKPKENLIVGNLLGGELNKYKSGFLIAYFLPIILILIIDFLLFNTVFKEFLIISAGIIFAGLALSPSRKVWQLLAYLIPYFLLFWVPGIFPKYLLSFLVVPIVVFSIYGIFHFYLPKNPNIFPMQQGVRWIAPVSGFSIWRFQIAYVIFASIFINLPVKLPSPVLLSAFLSILISWVVIPFIVILRGLKKAKNFTLIFLGEIVEK